MDLVDIAPEVTEEPIESNWIRCVEGRGTQGINLTGSLLEAPGTPAREDHPGPISRCSTCRFKCDASAPRRITTKVCPESSSSRCMG